MAHDLDTGLPSTRQIQTVIRDARRVELKLTTGDLLMGQVLWQDPHCICLQEHGDQSTIVWRQSIVFLKPSLS